MKVHYLEIVTPDPQALCAEYSSSAGAEFGDPVEGLGGARVASFSDGGMLGIRAPLSATEGPVIRPYFLVSDIEAALSGARAAGGEVILSTTQIPGYGRFAILMRDGIESGLWQVDS